MTRIYQQSRRTGCDYTSFFNKIGKATFYRYFYQNAEFITSGKNAPGTLADIGLTDGNFEKGFLSFLRLVGVTYFKKNNSGFATTMPHAHFKSILNPTNSPPHWNNMEHGYTTSA